MKKLIAIIISTLVGINLQAAESIDGPGLGQVIDVDELSEWEIGVMPDGRGLPEGSGSVEQGEIIYKQKCLACHGEGGLGDSGMQLAGAIHELTDEWPEQTIGTYWPYATTLFDFIRRSMPMTQPGSLSNEEVYAVVAYLLYLNNLVDEDAVMDAEAVRTFEMPNRNGFINIYELEKNK